MKKTVEIPKELDNEIPVEERIEDFYSLWNMIMDEVLSYWDSVDSSTTSED